MEITSVSSLLSAAKPRAPRAAAGARQDEVARAQSLKETYTQFVGETFYGQMLKSMRATVGEPAYFHGGMAERQFQARLDQQLATELGSTSGGIAEKLFEHEYPREAALLRGETKTIPGEGLAGLDGLRRL